MVSRTFGDIFDDVRKFVGHLMDRVGLNHRREIRLSAWSVRSPLTVGTTESGTRRRELTHQVVDDGL